MKRKGVDGATDAPCLASARAAPGIEPGTSRTLSENQATRPSSLVSLLMPLMTSTLRYPARVLLRDMSLGTPVLKKESDR